MSYRQNGRQWKLRTRYATFGFVVLSACLSVVSAQAVADFTEVVGGLEYRHERTDDPLSIHILRIDRKAGFDTKTTLGRGTIFGLESLSGMIGRIPEERGKPVAGINGDFYWIRPGPYQGNPSGLQIREGELVSNPSRRPAVWFDPDGNPHMGTVEMSFQVTWPDGKSTSVGLNTQRGDNQAVLYTPILGDSTRTEDGIELVLDTANPRIWLPLEVDRNYRARVRSVAEPGPIELKEGMMVLSIGPKLAEKIPAIKRGDTISLAIRTTPSLRGVKSAIGGRPILVTEGEAQSFTNEDRHPRTMIGWNERYLFWVVVDGRQEGLSRGMSFAEQAELMVRLGCTEALNLDGGGSSTMWVNGKVVNSPSDGRERSLANGLILLQPPNAKTKTENSQ